MLRRAPARAARVGRSRVTSDGAGGAFEADGPFAREIAGLWWLMLVLGVAVFAVFAVALVAGLLRRRAAADPGRPEPGPRSLRRWVIGGGVVMPTAVLIVVLALTIDSMRAVPTTAPAGALRVEVVGHRWWWEIRYPGQGVVTANELHIPVDRPIELRLTSSDVIHSLWVPALGGKMDLLPDGVNTLVLEADEAGVHRSQCAEFCGLQHARMGLRVVAEPEDRFRSWLAANGQDARDPADAASARGRDVFREADCGSCHTVRGTDARGSGGPDLTHLASRQTIAALTRPLTRQNLAEWIADPDAIKRGVDMPATELRDEDLAALLDYLEGLR